MEEIVISFLESSHAHIVLYTQTHKMGALTIALVFLNITMVMLETNNL